MGGQQRSEDKSAEAGCGGGRGQWVLDPGRGLCQDIDFGRTFLHCQALPSLAFPPQPSQRAWAELGAAPLSWAVTTQWWRGLPRKVLETPEPPGFLSKCLGIQWPLPKRKIPNFPCCTRWPGLL